MKRLPLVLILLCGCYQPPHPTPPGPGPGPDGQHARIAEQALRGQASRFATIAKIAAGKTETWGSNAEVYDWIKGETEKATAEAFKPLVDAENARVKPDGEWNAEAVRAMLLDEAEGFSRVAK